MRAGIDKSCVTVIGRANVGKSHLVKCLFNQKKSGVNYTSKTNSESESDSIKLLPNGSAAIIETVVIDSAKNIENLKSILMADFAIIVLDAREELFKSETELITFFQTSQVPFLIAINKIEYGTNPHLLSELDALEVTYFELSCLENAGLESFRKMLIHMLPNQI